MLLSSNDSTSTMRPVLDSAGDVPVRSSIVLRVCGGEHDGQMVRLSGRCCSVGSDRRCSLRLVSRSFQPLHLVMVRGPHGTVVKRWSEKTRLNGESFETAWLRPGDRLGLGNSFELEVLEDGREMRAVERLAELSDIEDHLCAALGETTVEDEVVDADFDLRVASSAVSEPLPDPSERRRRPSRLGNAVRKLRRRLQIRERELRTRRDELSRLLQTLMDAQSALARKETELTHARKQFESECQNWQNRTSLLQTQAKEEQQSHERLFAERYSAQQHQLILMTQERDQLQSEVQRMNERVSALSMELETVKTERTQLALELEQLRQNPAPTANQVNEDWLAERAELEEALLQLKQHSDLQLNQMTLERGELEQEFMRLREECESVAQQFQSERLTWEQRELEYAAECDQLRRDLAAMREPSDAESVTPWTLDDSAALEAQEADLRRSLELAGSEYGPADFASQPETFDGYSASSAAETDSWSSQASESSWSVTQEPSAHLLDLPSEHEPVEGYLEAPTFSEPSSAAPVDTAAILAKLGHFPQVDEEEEERLGTRPEPTLARPVEPPAMPTRSAPRESNHTEEERSIEDYMAELMRRVGSGPQATFRPAPSPPPQPVAPVVVEEPTVQEHDEMEAVPIAHLDELRMQREKLPPINLSAMRDVANQTARVAINQHVSRLGMQDAYWKLFLAGVGGMTGIGLTVLSKGAVNLPLAGALVAFIVTGIWLYRGLAVYRVVRRKRQLQEANQLLRGGAKNGVAALQAAPTPDEAS